jgi:ribonuclease III
VFLFLRRLSYIFHQYSEKDKRLITAIQSIVGSKPFNLNLYKLATQHTSVAREISEGIKESNERLEYLGDAVLGTVVAEYLFKKFPYKDEGFLTEIRSRIVNRESLNTLAKKIGINDIVEFDANRKNSLSHKSLYGDTLEAFVGAVYLDRGFKFCQKFILKKLIIPHFNLEEIVKTNPNYKSKIIEWAQRENKELRFELLEVKTNKHFKEFIAQVFVDDQPLSKGVGFSKKKAEQNAAQKSCEILKLT